jgi:hypothetical protein
MPFSATPPAWDIGSHGTVTGDELRLATENCGGACQDNAVAGQQLTGSYSVESTFTYGYASYGYAGVIFALRPAGSGISWWGCLLNRPGYQQTRYLAIWNYAGPGTSISSKAQVANPEDASRDNAVQRRIRVYVEGNSITCTFETDQGDTAQLTTNAPGNLDGRAGVRAYEADANFKNFVLYAP